MPRVFIPPLLRELSGQLAECDIAAESIRGVVRELDSRFPGMAARLCEGDDLRAGVVVAVNGQVSSRGLLQRVPPDAEVHFLPAVGGG